MTALRKKTNVRKKPKSFPARPVFSSDDASRVVTALQKAARLGGLRYDLLELLRLHQERFDNDATFAEDIRWPIVKALVSFSGGHRVKMKNKLVFEVLAESNIEKCFLLSTQKFPDHVWEPQTTRLLLHLSKRSGDIIVGGAYIGDQVLLLAQAIKSSGRRGVVHAFEPFHASYLRLRRNTKLNGLRNVQALNRALWDRPSQPILLKEEQAEAPLTSPSQPEAWTAGCVKSTTIDTYARRRNIHRLSTIMLDLEGGEERALHGAEAFLSLRPEDAPVVVFEIHGSHVNWSRGLDNTPVIKYLMAKGYECFAIRDYHSNKPMGATSIELIPSRRTYLKGPPHGFNMLAFKSDQALKGLPLSIIHDVSPKYLDHKNPRLHSPLTGINTRRRR